MEVLPFIVTEMPETLQQQIDTGESIFVESKHTSTPTIIAAATVTDAYHVLDTILDLSNPNHRFWWIQIGRKLAGLLQYAGYELHRQYWYLLFFYRYIIPALGPQPVPAAVTDGNGSVKPFWPSFMTDDHCPVELNWRWMRGQSRKRIAGIGISVEPIGMYAGTDRDPFNMVRMQAFLIEAEKTFARDTLDLTWVRIFENALIETNPNSHKLDLLALTHRSQYMAAFDLSSDEQQKEGGPSMILKAYFFPEVKSLVTGKAKLKLIDEAISEIPSLAIPWDTVKSYVAGKTHIVAEFIAIDCITPAASRVKFYIRSTQTSLASVKDVMTLGEKLANDHPELASGITTLEELWNLVLPQTTTAEKQPHSSEKSRTSGVLYYFELRAGDPCPYPKVYIPVRHYARHDLQIADGVQAFFENRYPELATSKGVFGQMLEHVFHQDLDDGLGMQTYVGFAIKKGGGFDITSYLNPEPFGRARFRTGAF